MGNPPAHQVMHQVAGMGERAHSHAAPAIRADRIPVTEASFFIEFPAQSAIDHHPFFPRDRITGAVLGALFTDIAEIDQRGVGLSIFRST